MHLAECVMSGLFRNQGCSQDLRAKRRGDPLYWVVTGPWAENAVLITPVIKPRVERLKGLRRLMKMIKELEIGMGRCIALH